MAIQGGIMTSREEKDLKAKRQALATECLRNTLIRTEKADERFLDDLLRRLKAEKDQETKMLAEVTEHLQNTLIRTEKAEERFLDDLLRRLKAEKAAQGKTE